MNRLKILQVFQATAESSPDNMLSAYRAASKLSSWLSKTTKLDRLILRHICKCSTKLSEVLLPRRSTYPWGIKFDLLELPKEAKEEDVEGDCQDPLGDSAGHMKSPTSVFRIPLARVFS